MHIIAQKGQKGWLFEHCEAFGFKIFANFAVSYVAI